MKISTFTIVSGELEKIDVELALTPGLPTIQWLGGVETSLKESTFRIRSAINACDFQWLIGQSLIVNLLPTQTRKSSAGIELAVAIGYLYLSGQCLPPSDCDLLIFGELSLNGEITTPLEIQNGTYWSDHERLITGPQTCSVRVPWISSLFSLKQVKEMIWTQHQVVPHWTRPERSPNLRFTDEQADILSLVALGEHPWVWAGPPGLGKTTMAKGIWPLLQEPQSLSVGALTSGWRPWVAPHHTTTHLGIIGGGIPLQLGEISRAHGGVLLLDELLEFQSQVQEALREPMEERKITLRRGRQWKTFSADTLVLATTNLCPCGDLRPGTNPRCGRSASQCYSYSDRLAGPVLDRFHGITFLEKSAKQKQIHLLDSILSELKNIREWRFQQIEFHSAFEKKSSDWSFDELTETISPGVFQLWFENWDLSERRKLSLARVARTWADLEKSKPILSSHIEKAYETCIKPYGLLKKLRSGGV